MASANNGKADSDPAESYLAELSPKARQLPRSLLRAAVLADSVPHLETALRASSAKDSDSHDSFLVQALSAAIRASSTKVLSHLVEREHAPVSRLSPLLVAETSSSEILEYLLVKGGYDVNEIVFEGYMRGRRLLDLMCLDDVLVRTLLDHGADPSLPLPEGIFDEDEAKPETLLERVAALGSVGTFKLLQAKGAKLGRQTLHRAAKSAAQIGVDPEVDEDAGDQEVRHEEGSVAWKAHRGPMLRYLVDDVGLDVNALDVEEGTTRPNTYGTPTNWAAREESGAKVVRWLLTKGADPHIKDCWGNGDAKTMAEQAKNDQVLDIIKQWEEQAKGKEDPIAELLTRPS